MDTGKYEVLELVPAQPGVWSDGGRFSPDGRHYACASNVRGSWEVHVCELARPSNRAVVSRPLGPGWAGGGFQPRWRADGKELYYLLDGETMMSVAVSTASGLTHETPEKLFTVRGMRGNFPDESPWLHRYDVTDDGERFVFVRKAETP